MKKTMTKKLVLAAVILAATLVGTAQVVKGLRVPQLTTTDRNSIATNGVSDPLAAGQQVFNSTTGNMEYFDGTYWVSVSDSIKAGGKYGIVVTGNGTDSIGIELPPGSATNNLLVWDTITSVWKPGNAKDAETVTTLTNNLSTTGSFTYMSEDSTYTTVNISALIHDSLTLLDATSKIAGLSLTRNGYIFELDTAGGGQPGEFLAYDGTWQTPDSTLYFADESTIHLNKTTNTFSVPVDGITTLQIKDSTIAWIDLSEAVKDSIRKAVLVDTIADRGGMTIETTTVGNNNVYKLGLIEGTDPDQILKWNATTSRWELATVDSIIRKVSISVGATYTTESVLYTGLTGTGANLSVVGIVPEITSPQGDIFIATNLGISTTAKAVGGAVAYTLRIKNDNIDTGEGFTIEAINIYYTSSDELTPGTPTGDTFVGQ